MRLFLFIVKLKLALSFQVRLKNCCNNTNNYLKIVSRVFEYKERDKRHIFID